MSHKKQEFVEVTEEFAKGLEVLRIGDAGGFQRKLRYERIGEMVENLKGVHTVPPILIGMLPGGRRVVVDGQHRLEAWKRSHYPLQALAYPVADLKEATKDFVETNAHQVRVGLTHRLRVDPGAYAAKVRKLAEDYGVSPSHIHNCIVGAAGGTNFYKKGGAVGKEDWALVDLVLSTWSKGKLWKRPGFVYSSAGALRVVADISRKSKSPAGSIKELQGLDWSRRGPLGVRCGTSFSRQKDMRDYIFKAIAESVL